MNESSQSPKRRHILSSINPEPQSQKQRSRRRSRSPRPEPDEGFKEENQHGEQDDDPNAPRRSRLKLKDHKSSRRRRRHRSRSRSRSRDRRHHHGESASPRRHRRHRRPHSKSPTPPNPFEEEPLDPETAFRESLFDAMADYEGANYWEGVYGQPIHIYSNERAGAQGELERMTDEEYAAHVRQKMWEKTHAGIIEERARREEARKRKEKEERHQRKLQEEMEESLRRGEDRRRRRQWVRLWDEYNSAWSSWEEGPTASAIAWPLESGRQRDIDEKSVRCFFASGLNLEELGEKGFLARLKDERVRWHPDKIQQKLGGKVDEETMKDVTAVFQIIDRLWSEMRKG